MHLLRSTTFLGKVLVRHTLSQGHLHFVARLYDVLLVIKTAGRGKKGVHL